MTSETFWAAIAGLNLTDWITALATLILCGLTFVYVKLTRNILRFQSDPLVIVSIRHDDDRATLLQLVISNIGNGVARDVIFDLSRPIPARAWGVSLEEAKSASVMKEGPLIDGIALLGPGENRKIDWGQYGGLKAALGDSPIVVTCRFKKGTKYLNPVVCPLEINSYTGTVAARSPNSRIISELEKMARSLEHFANGFKRLKVEVVALPDNDSDTERPEHDQRG